LIVLFKKEDLQKSGQLVKLGLPVMEKLEILKLSAEVAEKESTKSWQRFAMMLYASIALVAILLFTIKSDIFWMNVIPALIGIIVSIGWLKINALSSYTTERWHADLEAVIAGDEVLKASVQGEGPGQSRPSFSSKSAPFYVNLLPNAFLGLWAFVFLAVISSGLWRTPVKSLSVASSKGDRVHVERPAPATMVMSEDRNEPGPSDEPILSEPPGVETSQSSQVYVDPRTLIKARKNPEGSKSSDNQVGTEQAQLEGKQKEQKPASKQERREDIPF
jgi:hypothetical protein